jgi:hypothetical protein
MRVCVFLQLVQIMTNAFGSWFNVFFLLFRRLTSPGVKATTATLSSTRTFDIEPCSSDYVLPVVFLWRKGCSLLMLGITVSCLKQSFFIVKRCLMP